MTIQPVCYRCRHPRSLHHGTSGCTAPSCHGGPDHGPCPAFEPADARPEPTPVTAAVQAGPVPPMLVDVYGAAQLLRLGRCTVLALADAGELPKLRFGRALRFARSDLEALVERRKQEARSAGNRRQAG
jgi:excisionase family DNA binding protein